MTNLDIVSEIVNNKSFNKKRLSQRSDHLIYGESLKSQSDLPVRILKINRISLTENIRKKINSNSESFKSLVNSIKQKGLLQLPLIEERFYGKEKKYICVEGHQRILAYKSLGNNEILCLIKKYETTLLRVEDAIHSDFKNMLDPLSKAEAFSALKNSGLDVEEISKRFSLDKKTISRYLKLAEISNKSKNLIMENLGRFSSRFLLHSIAARKLTQEQILDIIEKKISEKKPEESKKTGKHDILSLINKFFDERKIFSKKERSNAVDLLKYLKVI